MASAKTLKQGSLPVVKEEERVKSSWHVEGKEHVREDEVRDDEVIWGPADHH